MANHSKNDIKLSIALVTRNREDSLRRTLESLSRQSIQPYEVIMSDDSDMQAMIDSNKLLAQNYGCKYIQGPGRGLYANRNFVAKYCSGTHIRSMDDDHEFPEDHIKACIEAIEKDNNAIWTIGEYYPFEKKKRFPPATPGQLHPRGFSYPPKNMNEYFGISCGASIYPRSVVDKNILNIEIYKFGILYLEYGARLFSKGYKIRHLNSTYIIHHYDENTRSAFSLQIINSAKIFSILMLSFKHRRSFKNKLLTIFEICKELAAKRITLRLVINTYYEFLRLSKMI